jgi:hypothetical protein
VWVSCVIVWWLDLKRKKLRVSWNYRCRDGPHDTNTTKHDTAGHNHPMVSWHASTSCRLLGPDTTRNTLSRVMPAREHGGHDMLVPA